MEVRTFDPGKYGLLMVGIILLFVCSINGQYECSYLEPLQDRAGWFTIEEMSCEYGCCGDLYKQRCCDKQEVDNKRWIVALAVIGGLLAVAVITIIVLCVLKKKNLERAKIYTNDPPAPASGNPKPETFCEISQRDSPPPPYNPVNYNIFTVPGNGRNREAQSGQRLPDGRYDPFIVQTSAPPTYSYVNVDRAT